VDRVRALGWAGVAGNTDELLWAGAAGAPPPVRPQLAALGAATAALLGPERIGWLRGLPVAWRHGPVRLVHASPGDLWHAPAPDASDEELAGTFAAASAGTAGEPDTTTGGAAGDEFAVYAHTHRPFVRRIEHGWGGAEPGRALTVANSGSVGWPL